MSTSGNTFHWYKSGEISGLSQGTHDVGEVEDVGVLNFLPTDVSLELIEDDNLITPPIVSVGTAPNYNNICPAQAVGGVLGKVASLTLQAQLPLLPDGTEIKAKVTAAATHLGSGQSKFKILVEGPDSI